MKVKVMKKYFKPETINVNIEGADLMAESPESVLGEPEVDPTQGMAPRKIV